MNGLNRATRTLAAAGLGGVGLWLIGHFDQGTAGGYWAALGIIAAAGLLFGLAQLRGAGGNPPAAFLLAFLPVLIVGGWVLIAMEPNGDWFRDHIRNWNGDIGISDVVHYVGAQTGVIAFAIGLTFGLGFEPGYLRRRRTAPVDQAAADAPLTAERRTPVGDEAPAEQGEVTTVR